MVRFSNLVLAVLAVLVLVAGASAAVAADDKDNSHEGKVVMAGNGMLTFTDPNCANRHMHKLGGECKNKLDGQEANLENP